MLAVADTVSSDAVPSDAIDSSVLDDAVAWPPASAQRMTRFAGKTAVVTGGAAGIGAACVRRLCSEGAAVVVADIDDKQGQQLVAELTAAGGVARYVPLDVADPAGWQHLAAVVQSDPGPPDVLVSNAALIVPGSASTLPLEDWNRQLGVNLTGLFLAAKTFAEILAARSGALVAVSSVHALFGLPGRPAYAASKGGITALVRQLAVEYGPRLRVNAVLPGPILTAAWSGISEEDRARAGRATALDRLGTAEEVAAAVAFLAGPDASFVTGASLLVDGGWSISKDSP